MHFSKYLSFPFKTSAKIHQINSLWDLHCFQVLQIQNMDRLRRGTRYDFTPSLTRKIHSPLATTVFNAALVLPHMLLHRKLAQHVLQTT